MKHVAPGGQKGCRFDFGCSSLQRLPVPAAWPGPLVLVLLTACKPAPTPAAALGPAPTGFPWTAPWAQAAPVVDNSPSPATSARPRWDLQVLGDIEREDGQVERSYRVTLHNGSQAQPGLLAQVSPAAAGVQVLQGLLVLGDVAPGTSRTAQRNLTLVHAADWTAQPADLAWSLSADAALYDPAGALLPGLPEQRATVGLRNWQPPLESGWRVQAMLNAEARLGAANQALQAGQLRIAQMRQGNHTLWLHPVGDVSPGGLQRAAQALQDSGAFLHARVNAPPAAAHSAAATADLASAAMDPHSCKD